MILKLSTAFLALAATALTAAEPGLLKLEFIYRTAPFPSCHASTLVETREGIVAAWFGGTAERNPDVGIWISHLTTNAALPKTQQSPRAAELFRAQTPASPWSVPVEVANGVESPTNRYPTWNPVLFQPKTGPLMLFYKVGPKPSEWWGMLMTSDDCGKTWSKPRRLPDGILGPIKNKPVQLANGDMLSPSSTEGEGGWRVHFERSSDLGRTWTATQPLNDGKEIAAIQPSLLFHPGNRLQAVGRTKQARLFEIWSNDGGQTWGLMTLTSLPNPNSGTDAVTLRDGRQLLVYNHNPQNKGRSPLNVAVSKDGQEWFAALTLEHDPGKQFSYPAVIQTSDGLVHVTYTWKRERIRHAVIDPAKLKLRPIVDGLWPK